MRAGLLLAALLLSGSCTRSALFHAGPSPDSQVEWHYTRALELLAPSANPARLDSAVTLLDAYLTYGDSVQRRAEATVLRRLASDAIQLAKVSEALVRERSTEKGRSTDPAQQRPDADALREIQRLKDELAAANAELERIRKRLGAQKP